MGKGCAFLTTLDGKKKKKQCKKKGTDGTKGKKGCPVACGKCPKECEDDDDWEFEYEMEMKGCDFLATLDKEEKKTPCKEEGVDGKNGYKACPVACGKCKKEKECEDDDDWE